MSKPYVPAVLSYCGLYGTCSLSDVQLTTIAGYAVNTRSPQSQVVLHRKKGTAPLPREQANTLMFGQLSAQPAVWRLDIRKKSDRGTFLEVLTASLRVGLSLDTKTVFLESGFEEIHLIVEAFLVTKSPSSVQQGRKNALCVGRIVV
jgi:hypothetical protein